MRNQYYIFFTLLFLVSSLHAQGVRYGSRATIVGKVIDGKTNEPVPYANIGFIGEGIGTVSDGEGNYYLEFAPAKLDATDRLQFSVIGYATRVFSKNEALLAVDQPFNISLMPQLYNLDEVVLGEAKRRNTTLGDLDYDERIIGYWKNIEGLGGEILTKIRVRKENTKLHNLKFKVIQNEADSLLIRVNVYGMDRGLVGENLLKQSIKYTIDTKEGLVRIPLEKYDIFVSQNIIVGIELLRGYGKQIGFSLAGSVSEGISYIRYRSQDFYRTVENTAMAFQLDVTIPDKRKNPLKKRETPEKLIVFWDASTKANKRNIAKELNLLESYLSDIKNAKIEVIKFAAGYRETNEFNISRGKSETLLQYLRNTQYGGIALFEELPRPKGDDNSAAFLFTSGDTILSDIRPDFGIPTFTITTNKEADFESLEDVALYSDGAFIPAFSMTSKEALKRLKYFIEDDPFSFSEPLKITVSGIVSYNENPIQGAAVSIKDTYRSSYTDSEGHYAIQAKTSEVLEVFFPGMKPSRKIIGEETAHDITLEPDSEILETLLVTRKIESDEKVDSPDRVRDPNSIGYKYRTIAGVNIRSNATTLGDVLSQIGELEVRKDPFNPSFELFIFPRTYYQPPYQPPIIVLDGAVYVQSGDNNNLPYVDPQNIESISVSSSLIAANIYGGIANGGVIKVKTKFVSSIKREDQEVSALVSDNDYFEVIPKYKKHISTLISALQNSNTLLEAKNLFFTKYKQLGTPDLTFFVDGFHFFKDKDPQFAKRVVTSIASLAPSNKEALRTMAFALEDLNEENLVVRLRSYLKEIAPIDIQSSRDLAAAFLENKQYAESFEMYKRILMNDDPQLDQKPLQLIAENEIQRLITLHKSKVSFQDIPNFLLKANFNKKARLLFEWSDPQAAFELQFISPGKKYFIWNHDPKVKPELIAKELKNGNSLREYEIDCTILGDWIVNVKASPGVVNKGKDMYLKYTLYTDYATQKERKQTKIISLEDLKEKVTIDQITIKRTDYEN